MDWVTVAFIVIFFVFPLIQQIAEARKTETPPADAGPADVGRDEATVERLPRRNRSGDVAAGSAPERPENWSADWGEWPGFEEFAADDEEVVEPEVRVVPPTQPVAAVRATPESIDDRVRPRPPKRPERPRRRTDDFAGGFDLTDLAAIRHPRTLKSVIVMSEILGRPRGLRD